MNYQLIYDSLINRAQSRTLEGYTEVHHIIPRCMGGGNESHNLVSLTPEEHYVAHQLLCKINPGNIKLAHAAFMMGTTRNNNKTYGWIKRKIALSLKGVPLSEEVRKEMSRSQRSRDPSTRYSISKHSFKGKKHSEATKKKMSKAAKKRKPVSEATKQRMKEAWVERRKRGVSLESRLKMSASHQGLKHSEETKEKISKNNRWSQTSSGRTALSST